MHRQLRNCPCRDYEDISARPFTWSRTFRKVLKSGSKIWCLLCHNDCVKHSLKRHLETHHKEEHDAEVEGGVLFFGLES